MREFPLGERRGTVDQKFTELTTLLQDFVKTSGNLKSQGQDDQTMKNAQDIHNHIMSKLSSIYIFEGSAILVRKKACIIKLFI